jgi:hypothetical protein
MTQKYNPINHYAAIRCDKKGFNFGIDVLAVEAE